MAVTYLGLCFWHFGQEGDSWIYLWATVAVWLFSVLGRLFYKNQALRFDSHWFTGYPTRPQALPGNMTRIEVLAPMSFSWKPGQHCYVRFPSLSALDCHPFTIAASPRVREKSKAYAVNEESDMQVLVFLARTHTGFTRRLSNHLRESVDLTLYSWVDGPYGGQPQKLENVYDTFILVAGGAGITVCLAWLLYLPDWIRSQSIATTRVKLLWAMKDTSHLGWISDELKQISASAPAASVTMDFFVTGQEQGLSEGLSTQGSKELDIESSADAKGSLNIQAQEFEMASLHQGRPNLPQIVPSLISPGRTVVIGMWPSCRASLFRSNTKHE